MNVSARRAFALLKEMAYERVSCTENETRAAERLLEEVKKSGADGWIETFTVPCGRVHHAKLVVTEPYVKEYECTGYERSMSTPEGGLDAEFYYAEDLLPENLEFAKGKAVLINGRLRRSSYEKLQKAGVSAILTYSGTTVDRRSETDCDVRKLREVFTEPFGFNVALNIRAEDAAEIVRRGAKKMHIEVDSECYDGTSRNVCAVIPGEKYPDEIISFGAHYDSTRFSTGVYDNMSGSVVIMELLKYFAEHRPARTMKFNWFGSEEQGLLGSKAWVRDHIDELDRHVLMINVDVVGATLGRNEAVIMATEPVGGYVNGLMREIGIPCKILHVCMSSDGVPFADNGVPVINFVRSGADGANYIHERRDNLRSGYIDEKSLGISLDAALHLARRVDGSAVCPVPREISEDIKGKIDEYLFRK